MNKKNIFNLKNVVISIILFVSMMVVGTFTIYNNPKEQQPAEALEWVDKLMNTSVGQGITKGAPVFTVVNGAVSLSGSIYKGITAAISANDGEGVEAFFKAFIGGEGSAHQQIMNSLEQIQESINVVSGKIDVIDTKVNEIKTQLDGISSQLNTMLNVIQNDLKQSVEDIKVSLYTSELEMKEWTTIYNQINDFYNKYADVKTTLTTHIDTIKARSVDFENFLQNAYNLDNGEQIRSVVKKITLNYNKSYNSLSQKEKNLLETEVQLNSNKYKVGDYIKDYNEFVYTYLKNAYDSFASGYSSNMYLTFLNMSDYILGNKSALNNAGIGEVYYKLSIMGYSTNTEVHNAYKKFVANVLTDFMLTGYVCDMSLQMQTSYLESNNGNKSDIQTYKDYIVNIKEVIQKCITYFDYEYQKCIYNYDINGFTPANGYTIDDYIVLYGNTVNKLKTGETQTRYILKKDYNKSELVINNQYVYLASGESSEIKIYYANQEIQNEFEFESSNESVAVVSRSGNITGLMPGDCVISIKDKYASYPIVSVSVSTAYVVQNGTSTNIFEYDSKNSNNCFSVQGTGLTYKYNSNIVSLKNEFDTDEYKLGSISSIIDVRKSFLKDFTFFSNNPNIVIDGDKVKTHIATSGTITAYNSKENLIIQIPINGTTEKVDIFGKLSSSPKTDDGTIYIYTKDQLKQWRDDTQNKVESVTSKNVKLMADIDFEWDEWEVITSSSLKYKVFDGNMHEIKNITIKGITATLFYRTATYYSLFYFFMGTMKNLTINNIAYKEPENDDTLWKYYGVFTDTIYNCEPGNETNVYGEGFINCKVTGIGEINTSGTVSFYAFYRIGCMEENKCYINVKNCVYDLNLVINCVGYSSSVTVVGFHGKQDEMSWAIYAEGCIKAETYLYSSLQKDKCYNLFSGSVRVEGISASNVTIERFTEYSGEALSKAIPTFLYYESSVCSAADYLGNVTYFSSEDKGTKITYEQAKNSTFWSDRGFSSYDIKDLISPYDVPELTKNYFNADFGSFNTTYLVGKNPDTQKIKFYDNNGNDVTKNVQFSSIDTTTIGKKTINATYGSETISFDVNYVDYASGFKIQYFENEENTENVVVQDDIASNSMIFLEDAIFKKENCIQVGWSKIYGGEKDYSINQKINITENIILYPVFEQIESDDQAKTITVNKTKEQLETGVDLTNIISQISDSENSLIVNSDKNITIKFNNLALKQLTNQSDVILKVTKGNNADYGECEDSFIITLNNKQFGNGEVKVSFELNEIDNSKGKLKVYYVNENNERVDMNAVYSGSTISFNTKHFSTFIVVYEKSPTNIKLIITIVEFVIFVCLVVLLAIRLKKHKKRKA